MFSSNQILEISGEIHDTKALEKAIDYAFSLENGKMKPFQKVIVQQTAHGAYCLGTYFEKIVYGILADRVGAVKSCLIYLGITIAACLMLMTLTKIPAGIIAAVVKQFLDQQTVFEGPYDGSYEKGFLLKAVNDDDYSNDEILNPQYAICSIWPFTNFYAK